MGTAHVLRKDNFGPSGFRWLTLKRITVSEFSNELVVRLHVARAALILPSAVLRAVQGPDGQVREQLGQHVRDLAPVHSVETVSNEVVQSQRDRISSPGGRCPTCSPYGRLWSLLYFF